MSSWTDADGNSLGHWEVMDRAEFWAWMRDNHERLHVFSTLTDPEGVYGSRQVYTSWGFRDEDAPRVDVRDYKNDSGETIEQVCRRFVLAASLDQETPS